MFCFRELNFKKIHIMKFMVEINLFSRMVQNDYYVCFMIIDIFEIQLGNKQHKDQLCMVHFWLCLADSLEHPCAGSFRALT